LEQSAMKILKALAIFAVGFLLGVVTFHPRSVAAQGGGSIYVKEASIGEFTTSQGSRVVGFSCVSREQCYVATQ